MGNFVDFQDLVRSTGEWLRGDGPQAEIVISSRIRLARNLAQYPFISRANENDRSAIDKQVTNHLRELRTSGKLPESLRLVDVSQLEETDRRLFVERQLISRELAESEGPRSVAFDADEHFSLMVNEEDHLRLQVMHSGLDVGSVWRQACELDDLLESGLTYAFHERLGFLTACPTNVGTGLRLSVMVHLPALVITRQIDKVFVSLQKISLAVRGSYGEGSQAMGDFYQISNQVTLGVSEEEVLKKVGDVIPLIVDYERQAREILMRESQESLHDRVSRAFAVLRSAQTISSEETMHHLSSVRLGVNLGLIKDIPIDTVNKLFIHTQPAHLQQISGEPLDSSARNIERARYLREHLNVNGGNHN